jgi:hypothetical protein
MKRKLLPSLFLIVALLFVGAATVRAAGASLYLSPPTGTYQVGNTFSVVVKVNSGGVLINAADGSLNFNSSQLQVLNVSKSSSIFSLWTKEPTFSNSAGIIEFGGGTPTNFTGATGTIFTINFRAIGPGGANLNFLSGSILAADGKGTNVLASLDSGVYTLTSTGIAPPTEEYVPSQNTPAGPIISSSTHPDSEKWYSNNAPRFGWEVTEDITTVRLLADHSPFGIPTIFYSEPLSQKQLKDLEDGIWYLHVQLQNQFGWGKVSHFKFQIDTEPPSPFNIQVKEGGETTNPRPTLLFEATDRVSGIDYYEIKIDAEEPFKVHGEVMAHNPYQMPFLTLGQHTVIVKAVDKAGNYTIAMTEINILPVDSPVITDYPRTLLPGSTLSLEGTAIAEAVIKVFFQKEGEEPEAEEVKSDEKGMWSFSGVILMERGTYKVWAEVADPSKGISEPSEEVTIVVSPPIFIRIGEIAIDYLTTFVTLLAIIFAIIFGAFWGWKKIKAKMKRVKREVTEAEKVLYQAFKDLKEEVRKQVANLDGKPDLNENEKKISEDLKEALKVSEKSIGKEIKDIEKELK